MIRLQGSVLLGRSRLCLAYSRVGGTAAVCCLEAAARRAAHHKDALCHFLVLYGLCVAQSSPNKEQAQQEGKNPHLACGWVKTSKILSE
jgi:hypothetical protein